MGDRKARCKDGEKRVIGYIRVSTSKQALSGLGLKAQIAQIKAECERRGWCLQEIACDEGRSAKTMTREGIQKALSALKAGEADILMVAKADRATRSVSDLYSLMDSSAKEGWWLIDLETSFDSSDPTGRMIAGMRGVVSQWEREITAKRTKEALAQKKLKGVRLGAPVRLRSEVASYVKKLKKEGLTVMAIRDRLESEAMPTATGGRWHVTTVQRIVSKQ